MKPSLRSALGPSGRPSGDGLRFATASWPGPLEGLQDSENTGADSTLILPIRGRRLGVGAPNPILNDEECPESVLEGEFDVKKCGPGKVVYRITSSLCEASVDAARLEVEYDPGNEAHRDFYDLVPDDFMVSMEADPDPMPGDTGAYEFVWDGRDDTDDERILLGGKFFVSVEADISVTGDGWGEVVTEADSAWQEVSKPHASNYGQYYPTNPENTDLPTDSTNTAGLARDALAELTDKSGFVLLPEAAVLTSAASQVIERLKNRDAVMTFGGHSGPGLIQFCTDESIPDYGGMSNIAMSHAANPTTLPTEYLSMLPSGELDDVFLVLLLGCNTAVPPADDGLTLQASLLSLGVDVVIAFPGFIKDELGEAWAKEFWCFATTGHGAGLYSCSFWDSNPGFEPESDLHNCNSASGGLPSIEEAARCASVYVISYSLGYDSAYLNPISDVEIGGTAKTERLSPGRYGSTAGGYR